MLEAIILAGGKGDRLGALTNETPKSLLPVGSRPFLEYVLDYLSEQGISRVIFALGYQHEKIQFHFGERYKGLKLSCTVEEELLGTGGAIRLALGLARTEHVMALNGDTLFKVPLDGMLQLHHDTHADLTIALASVDDVSRYGQVLLDDHKVVGFKEKDTTGSGYINGGLYVLHKERILTEMPLNKFSFECDFLPKSVSRLSVHGFVHKGYFIDIGVPQDYAKASVELGRTR